MPTQRRGYATGGYVEPQGYAQGGLAQGTDTIPAMLTPGEFVVSRPAVRQIGLPNLQAMNAAGGGTNRPHTRLGRMYAHGGGLASKPYRGANNNFLTDFAADYQRKFDEANAANEARYKLMMGGYDDLHARTMGGLRGDTAANEAQYANILGQYGGLRDRVLGGMETLGQDQIAESRKAYDESLAATNAQMASRGLAGTTVGSSIKQGTDRGYQDAVRGIQESVLARRAAADMGISQAQIGQASIFQNAREAGQARRMSADMGITTGKLGAMERREDEHPDFGNLMALTQGAAAGGYGQGYGSGGYDDMFSIGDYFGSGGSPYEAVAAGMLNRTAGKNSPYVQTSPTGR